MEERAFYFTNRTGENLFCVHHQVKNSSSLGVVFCHPFGDEKQRSYRVLRNFSHYLADQKFSSFRFDMKGTGDSDGELEHCTMESFIKDVQDAISEFMRLQPEIKHIALVGVRLGATVAALTAELDSRVVSLALHSPVVQGRSYWRELMRIKQFSFIALNEPPVKTVELMRQLKDTGYLEIEAQKVSNDFVEQLQKVDLVKQALKFEGDLLITNLSDDLLGVDLAEKVSAINQDRAKSIDIYSEEEREYWTNVSLYDQFKPHKTYDLTTRWLMKIS